LRSAATECAELQCSDSAKCALEGKKYCRKHYAAARRTFEKERSEIQHKQDTEKLRKKRAADLLAVGATQVHQGAVLWSNGSAKCTRRLYLH
jgi:hypothetical protein